MTLGCFTGRSSGARQSLSKKHYSRVGLTLWCRDLLTIKLAPAPCNQDCEAEKNRETQGVTKMTFTDIGSPQDRLETMLTEQWNKVPEPKPTYARWFYGDGGPRDVIDELLNKMLDTVERFAKVTA